MRRFAKFLKDAFAVAGEPRRPASAFEMTLHDALRICAAGRLPQDEGAALPPAALRRIDVCRYRSELDLHDQWRRLDNASRQAANLTVILELDDFLRGNLRELIRRRRPAYRLVIVPRAGHWPGTDSFGDLALASGSLGWGLIELCRNLGDALENGVSAFGQDEGLLVVLPARPSESLKPILRPAR